MADYGDPEWDDEIEECTVHLYALMPCDKCRITELEAENKIFRSTESVDDSVWDALLEQVRQFQAKLDAVQTIAVYANNQADMAQIRLLKDKYLYDDSFWQPVLDRIRFDLMQIKATEE